MIVVNYYLEYLYIEDNILLARELSLILRSEVLGMLSLHRSVDPYYIYT